MVSFITQGKTTENHRKHAYGELFDGLKGITKAYTGFLEELRSVGMVLDVL